LCGCEEGASWQIRINLSRNGRLLEKGTYFLLKTAECNRNSCHHYHTTHAKQRKEHDANYYEENKDRIKEHSANYLEENREYLYEKIKEYNKSPKGKEVMKKHRAKRRELGFEPLNKPFENCHAHHVNSEEVIYIPVELHRSVFHNLETGVGMEEMNNLAITFLEETKHHD